MIQNLYNMYNLLSTCDILRYGVTGRVVSSLSQWVGIHVYFTAKCFEGLREVVLASRGRDWKYLLSKHNKILVNV